MNTNASKFVDTLTRKFSSIVDKILRHPYLLSVEGKKLSREDLKVFVCEHNQTWPMRGPHKSMKKVISTALAGYDQLVTEFSNSAYF